MSLKLDDDETHAPLLFNGWTRALQSTSLAIALACSVLVGGGAVGTSSSFVATPAAHAETTTTSTYDGFAEYAKTQQMEKSDVGCFVNQCGDETIKLFQNPRGIKGVVCLGKCKGEQFCSKRCFAQYGSEALNSWLSCTIEEHECVKVPKGAFMDNSAEEMGYANVVSNFDASSLVGTWYKTDGLNPNYDLFDCQTNTFTRSDGGGGVSPKELDMDIRLRITRPESDGGGYWNNALTEHMVMDTGSTKSGRTMHTEGKMYGLTFDENWYILGEAEKPVPFKLVAFQGHTLQGNYEGAFVYAKEPQLPKEAIPAVREAAAKAGLNFDEFTPINNACPTDRPPLNDDEAGTSGTDWADLVVGEGGVIDWMFPGWRGEYRKQ